MFITIFKIRKLFIRYSSCFCWDILETHLVSIKFWKNSATLCAVEHTQTQNCLSVFEHFVAPKGLKQEKKTIIFLRRNLTINLECVVERDILYESTQKSRNPVYTVFLCSSGRREIFKWDKNPERNFFKKCRAKPIEPIRRIYQLLWRRVYLLL